MRLVQITDIHLDENGQYAAGTDVHANFARAVAWIHEQRPDAIVCTGDIMAEENSIDVARTAIRTLADAAPELHLVPGNHDDPALLAMLASEAGCESSLPYTADMAGARLLFLDTANGTLGAEGRAAIKKAAEAAQGADAPLVILVHHPLCVTGCDALDRAVALEDLAEAESTLRSLEVEFHVFCGHFHSMGSTRIGKGWVHRTGAVSFAVPCDAVEFAVAHRRPSLRMITIEDGAIASEPVELAD